MDTHHDLSPSSFLEARAAKVRARCHAGSMLTWGLCTRRPSSVVTLPTFRFTAASCRARVSAIIWDCAGEKGRAEEKLRVSSDGSWSRESGYAQW